MQEFLGFMVVIAAAAAAATIVYRLALRRGTYDNGWTLAKSAPAEPLTVEAPSGREGTYLPVVPSPRSWQGRAIGVFGLFVVVCFGAVMLAVALYSAGSFVIHLMKTAAHSGG